MIEEDTTIERHPHLVMIRIGYILAKFTGAAPPEDFPEVIDIFKRELNISFGTTDQVSEVDVKMDKFLGIKQPQESPDDDYDRAMGVLSG